MKRLQQFLTEQGYTRVKMRFSKTNHFVIKARINGERGLFILDTGASNSCVGFEGANDFNLVVTHSEIKAASASTIDIETKISKKNNIAIGAWKTDKMTLVLFDLTHVNMALVNQKETPVNGIIGAEVLKKRKCNY